jgi:hypothetical protein
MKTMMVAIALTAAVARPAAAEPPQVGDGKLVDEHRMTLYVFDHDAPGKSTCTGACVANWPPALADGYDHAAGPLTLVARRRQQAMGISRPSAVSLEDGPQGRRRERRRGRRHVARRASLSERRPDGARRAMREASG